MSLEIFTGKLLKYMKKYNWKLIFWHHIKMALYKSVGTPIAENVVPKINTIVLR